MQPPSSGSCCSGCGVRLRQPLLASQPLRQPLSSSRCSRPSLLPGYTYDEIGQAVGRSSSTCWRYVHKTLQHGGIYMSPINHGGRRHEIFGVRGRHLLCALVSRFRTLSLERYAEWMSRALGTIVTPDAVGKQLRGMGITSKVLEKLYAECAMHARCRARKRPRPHEPRARSLARSAGRSRPRPFDGLPPTRSS